MMRCNRTQYVKVTSKDAYTGSVTKKFTVLKAANPMKVFYFAGPLKNHCQAGMMRMVP